MKQSVLNRAVARATGESVDRIQRMGFGLVRTGSAHPAVTSPVRRTNLRCRPSSDAASSARRAAGAHCLPRHRLLRPA